MKRTWVNGVEQEVISASDRGLQFGDGLFETMAVVNGVIRRLEIHLDRLELGCARLGIPCAPRELLDRELRSLSGSEQRAVLKVIVTRGAGGRGYQSPMDLQPTRIVRLHEWPPYPADRGESGVVVRWCSTTLAEQPHLAGIKHLNRLEQVLARREWSDPEIAEGLMCDRQGRLIGGTMTNLFLVRGNQLLTPRVDRCGVAGTVRAAVIGLAEAAGMRAVEKDLFSGDVEKAEELFLTNAVIGIWPVSRIDKRLLSVGPTTRKLQRLLNPSGRLPQ